MARPKTARHGLTKPSRADSEIPEEVSSLINELESRDWVYQTRTSDPSDGNPEDGDLPEGTAMIYVSSGAATGDDGDVILAVNSGGTVKTTTLADYSAI